MNNVKISNKNKERILIDTLAMIAGSFIFAVSVSMFTSPNNIVPGGVTGVSTLLNYCFGLPIGTMSLIINVPIFIWGAIENGKGFLIKTIIATTVSSVLIDVTALFIPPYKGDVLLASLFGGILSGVGLALIFYSGGTTGGTDIIAKNIKNHRPYMSLGTIILIADIFVIVAAIAVYGNIENGLYAAITIFVGSKVIDTLVYGFARDNGQLMYIISDRYKEISDNIMFSLVRGVTILDGEGAYTKENKKVIMCAVRPRQVYKVKSIVNQIDPAAFIVVTKAGLITGTGFPKQL